MAEANGEDENPYSTYGGYAGKSERHTGEDSDDNDENPVKPDLGIGNAPNVEKKTVAEGPVTFKSIVPDILLPPHGTQISAAVYYTSNFLRITKVIIALEDEASSVVAAKKLLKSLEVRNDLTFIAVDFGFLPQVIFQLQETGQPLMKTAKIVNDAVQRSESIPRKGGALIWEKYKMVFLKNPDLDKLRNI